MLFDVKQGEQKIFVCFVSVELFIYVIYSNKSCSSTEVTLSL